MTLASKKATRYLLPAIPTLYLLAGWGWYQLGQWVNKRIANKPMANKLLSRPLLIASLCLILLFTLFYHPYYLTYYNPAVLGWWWAPQTILVGWGEGLDQAAAYLNRQPPGSWPPGMAGSLPPFITAKPATPG